MNGDICNILKSYSKFIHINVNKVDKKVPCLINFAKCTKCLFKGRKKKTLVLERHSL